MQKRYDRQTRLWGHSVQAKIESDMNILAFGWEKSAPMRETLKNLALIGVHSIVLVRALSSNQQEEEPNKEADIKTQSVPFFSYKDPNFKQYLQQLNPGIEIELASITSSLNLESICEAQNKDLKFDNKKCVCITSLDAICYSNAIKQILLESELLKHLPILISHQLRIAGKHFLPTCGLVICDFKKIQLSSKLMPKTVLMSTDCSSSSDESNLSGDSETNQILENSLKIPKFDSDESKSEVVDEEVTLSSTSLENLLSSNFVAEKLKSLKLDNSSNNYKILEDYQRTIESQSDHLDVIC